MLLTLGRCNPWISSAQSDLSLFGVFCIISRSLLKKNLFSFTPVGICSVAVVYVRRMVMVSSLSMNLPFIFRSSPPIALYDFIDIYGNSLRLCCCCVLDEGVGVVQCS